MGNIKSKNDTQKWAPALGPGPNHFCVSFFYFIFPIYPYILSLSPYIPLYPSVSLYIGGGGGGGVGVGVERFLLMMNHHDAPSESIMMSIMMVHHDESSWCTIRMINHIESAWWSLHLIKEVSYVTPPFGDRSERYTPSNNPNTPNNTPNTTNNELNINFNIFYIYFNAFICILIDFIFILNAFNIF